MKEHVRIYREFFEYGTEDVALCECCGDVAVDVHHIDARGMGGSDQVDVIENLMGLCRHCHETYGDIKHLIDELIKIHVLHIKNWIENKIKPFEYVE